jgi:hypothetical protein
MKNVFLAVGFFFVTTIGQQAICQPAYILYKTCTYSIEDFKAQIEIYINPVDRGSGLITLSSPMLPTKISASATMEYYSENPAALKSAKWIAEASAAQVVLEPSQQEAFVTSYVQGSRKFKGGLAQCR